MAGLVLTLLAAVVALPLTLRAQSPPDPAADTLAISDAVEREGPKPDSAWAKPIVINGDVAWASVSVTPNILETFRLERTADAWAIVALEQRCSRRSGTVACGPPASCTAIPLEAWLILAIPLLVLADLVYCVCMTARAVMRVW